MFKLVKHYLMRRKGRRNVQYPPHLRVMPRAFSSIFYGGIKLCFGNGLALV